MTEDDLDVVTDFGLLGSVPTKRALPQVSGGAAISENTNAGQPTSIDPSRTSKTLAVPKKAFTLVLVFGKG